MIRVGITGGIGSGKTTFCKEWEDQGAFVLYADDLAKELMVTDEKLVKGIKKAFGEEAYDEKGQLNRGYLAEEAFQKGRVKELNDLVHPVLWEHTDELAQKKEKEGVDIFAYEAAILLNNGRPQDLDYVILLSADEEQRIQRTVERDASDEKLVRERMSKQPDFDALVHLADFIVLNDGSEDDLRIKARNLYHKIMEWVELK